MANKLYKQTLKGRPDLTEVHEAIGRHGGLILRIDQTDAKTTAYFEADERASQTLAEAGPNIEETSLKEVTRV